MFPPQDGRKINKITVYITFSMFCAHLFYELGTDSYNTQGHNIIIMLLDDRRTRRVAFTMFPGIRVRGVIAPPPPHILRLGFLFKSRLLCDHRKHRIFFDNTVVSAKPQDGKQK